ncbi:DNA (cytosine-5)-methyltransferase 1 [Antricoccus suffuscus]|uniref:Cytosine-specific methyltransferase n=1 Tax=Antricoccus suffuscus TaxID=1629062 RepID=A0A2T0ZTQ7_9ACTN|nr:DNA cytosine methyltransferase [Antricoccus suffuscus]PRZ39647.1 DNA (cytosine-5)-methyltransferase 1 [Antricoccus suffuscus]
MAKRTAVSLFSGCGGFCEGVRLAGFDVQAAVEIDRFASSTYRENFPEVPLFEGDIHAFLNDSHADWTDDESKRFGHLKDAEVDLLFGGPPCQGYSQIGTRILDDPRNELYLQYIRVLKQLRPKVFLMENVPNMLLLAKGRFKREVLEAFAAAGYTNSGVTVVSAADYGVPQVRRRAIFFGIRDGEDAGGTAEDLIAKFLKEQERPAPTAWAAIRDLPERTAIHYENLTYPRSSAKSPFLDEMRLDRDGERYTAVDKVAAQGVERRMLSNHHTKEIRARRKALIALLEPGAKGDSLPKDVWDGLRPEKWRRLPVDRPAYTILAQMHRDLSEWVHPKFERWITVREAGRLQSFHDGFVFYTSEWQMLKQIGNAVPPLLGRAVAASAIEVLDRIDEDATTLDLGEAELERRSTRFETLAVVQRT